MVVSESSDEQSGPQVAAAQRSGTDGESAARFGQRMEASEEEAERYSDVEDSDPESGTAAQKRAGTAVIPNMVAAFARRVDGDQDE
jgi:hypothetical protein